MIDINQLKQSSIPDTPEYFSNPANTSQLTRIGVSTSTGNLPRIVEVNRIGANFNSSGVLTKEVTYTEIYQNIPLVEVTLSLSDGTFWKLPLRDGKGGVGLIQNITNQGFTIQASSNPVDQPYAGTKAVIIYRVWSFEARG